MLIQRPKAIVGISFALACTFLTLCVLVLSQMRHDAERRAEDAAINIALLVDRDTTRNLELYDLSLQAVIDRIRQPGLATLPPEIRQEVLFDRSTSAQDLGSIFVTDAAGDGALRLCAPYWPGGFKSSPTATTSRRNAMRRMSGYM